MESSSPNDSHDDAVPPSRSQHRASSSRRCGFPECTKTAKPGGLCISHGGGKKCAVPGCSTSVVSRGFCVAHGGGKRCQHAGCAKSAQTGGFCWIHGGGKKCGFQGCAKRAQSGGACISHGGGKRCRVDGCNKVVQYDGLCVGHGGYRRCLSINCAKKALANSYCQLHGGHSQCTAPDCGRKAVKGGLCGEHKNAAAAAAAALTPVQQQQQQPAAVHPHHCIEPRKNKQQQQQQGDVLLRPAAASSSSGGLHSPPERSRFCGASPVKALHPAWQLRSRSLHVQPPGYEFAKDRPSLHMDPLQDGALATLGQRRLGSCSASSLGAASGRHDYAGGSCGGTGFGGSPMLPAIRTISPLACFGDSPARPSLALGKRSSPATISSSSPPRTIKRLASLANIAKLSRPLTPLVASTPVIPPTLRPSPSECWVESAAGGGGWFATPCQVPHCGRLAIMNDVCELHDDH
ncbi:hypothetical protein PybrP1_012900 [[Pythium] brassicae (nom. inval.)]|nr:hypothetical protein PybrP1_012900 [[Pythium] brassicae (nom. inval.)]